ncbi:trypsin-like serine protease [Vibrio harveyi]|uniref:trypsin-like serine protease n=1 Tax=Vibrio harveyi TaxID=669 RepID=UPI003CF3D719
MKALTLLPLALLSAQSYAVVNGTPVDWTQHDSTVRLDTTSNYLGHAYTGQCTGTLIAGRYVITAAHCLERKGDVDTVVTANGDSMTAAFETFTNHPEHENGAEWSVDAGLIPVERVEYSHVQFFANPNVDLIKGESIYVAGFGGTANDESPLQRADFSFKESYWNTGNSFITDTYIMYLDMVNNSHTTGGDSGSAWVNADNEIVGIHTGSASHVDWDADGNEIHWRETYATNIPYIADWILEQIDGWHYPTVAEVDGQSTITIQSLHMNNIDDNGFYVEGDASIISNTCNDVNPYEKCTITVQSNGDEGALILGTTNDGEEEVITINPPKDIPMIPITPPTGGNTGSNGGDSSGGSFGIFGLLGLAGLALQRKRR